MIDDALKQRLLGTFLEELSEQVQGMNGVLLRLEKLDPASSERRKEMIAELFRAAHSLKGAARAVGIGPIEQVCHHLEDLLAQARDGGIALSPTAIEVLFRAVDALDVAGMQVRAGQDPAPPLQAALADLTAAALGDAPSATPALAPGARDAAPEPPGSERVRVPIVRLDALLSASQELLVARRRVENRTQDLAALQDEARRWKREHAAIDRPLRKIVDRAPESGRRVKAAVSTLSHRIARLDKDLERLSSALSHELRALDLAAAEVEDLVRRVRMVPFSEACAGLDRIVRDVAASTGREAELEVRGPAVEVGRIVLDTISIALQHLVRNAVDHGIEAPDQRVRAGKPRAGKIVISATQQGPQVEIVVSDDGRGFDLEALRSAARRRGLATPTDSAARWLAFTPGLSTAPMVTEVSGRGVGLDVVRRRVEGIQGTIDVHSTPGRGTQFSLVVPLTVVTSRVLLVSAAGQTFALPTTAVRRLLRFSLTDLRTAGGRPVLPTGDELLPVASLSDLLGVPTDAPGARMPAVVVGTGSRQLALRVDELLAETDAVVRPLGARLEARLVAGAMFLPTGALALVLRPGELLTVAAEQRPVAMEVPPLARPRRVLVVDDSVTTRSLLQTVLESHGYQVISAVDGADAWRILNEQDLDLVVADVEMPGMDGIALTAAIRSSRRHPRLPVVLVTSLEGEADRARGMQAGADAWLPKRTFDQGLLLETLTRLS